MPPGWLPLGTWYAAKGNPLPALLGTLGFGAIAALSLARAYRTCLRLYTGQYSAGRRPTATVAASPLKKAAVPAGNALERVLPFVSEPAAAVALGGFRSLIRAGNQDHVADTDHHVRCLWFDLCRAVGAHNGNGPAAAGVWRHVAALLMMGQFLGNQFGFDRGGFRVFVLSAAPRRIFFWARTSLSPRWLSVWV